ncbi:MAG: hypothetical protein ACM3Q9_02335 [Methanosarcina sp.]
MKIRRASSNESGSVSIREHLHRVAAPEGIRGEDLVIEVVQWGLLKEDLIARGRADDPTVLEYAERFNRTPDQAQADFDEFVEAVGVEPLVFWHLEEEALAENARPAAGGGPLDEIYVVAES